MEDHATVLLIDLECTCNDDPPLPKGESEIIEIGAVVGNLRRETFTVVDEAQIYVHPVLHPVLTDFCTELTGIRQDQVDNAATLDTALITLQHWLSNHSPAAWGSWGKFDHNQFQQETAAKQLANPLAALPHINVKQEFARKRGKRVGLARAVHLSGLTFQGRHHSGLDDTKNIAQLIGHDALLREAILKAVSL